MNHQISLGTKIIASVAKFLATMVLMTTICASAWDAYFINKVYYTDDGVGLDYLFPGGWVGTSGWPVVVVKQIDPPGEMGHPDQIKEGWSVTKLWSIWLLLFGASVIISAISGIVPWITMINRLIDRFDEQPTNPA